jgi:hypothetical protein
MQQKIYASNRKSYSTINTFYGAFFVAAMWIIAVVFVLVVLLA